MPEDMQNDKYVRTFHGHQFFVEGTDPEDIDIRDIAHALSNTNRFTGHTNRTYSVAEHSILVMDITKHLYGSHPEMLLCALMHDASEAYLADISSPIKQFLPDYKKLEARISDRIMQKFCLPMAVYHERVKHADWIAVFAEGMELQPNGSHHEWASWDKYGADAKDYHKRFGIPFYTPAQARKYFLREFDQLMGRLNYADLVNWRGSPSYA